MEPISCTSHNCEIGALDIALNDCDNDGDYDLDLNFEFANVENVGFDFFINEDFFGFYSYNDLPLELHDLDLSFGDQGLNFKVCENDNPDCCSSLTLEAPTDCPEEEDCFGFDAFEQSFYGAAIDNEPGDVIYESENLSISIHSFIDAEGESQFGAAIVQHAINHPSFTTAIEEYMLVEVINLLFNLSNYPTPIESVSIDLYRDYGGINLSVNDGELLFFETFPEGITDLGNDIQMEVIPSLEDPNLAHVIFTGNVQHLLIGGRHLDLDNLCINPDLDCHLNNLHLSHTACNDNNQYFVQVDFDYSQVSDSFYLWVEGRDTGLFSYENLPLQLGPIQGPADEEWIFGIADMLDSTCTIGDTLSLVTCEEECYINEVSLTPTECFDDGQFKILLDFEHEFTGLYFHVIINNQFYGEFHYDELPLYLGPFTGDGSTEWNIEIFDQSEICNASASLPPVSCAQECTISNIVVEPYACEEGLFFVDLAFDAINTGESGYIVFADGQISGPHSYEEPFITLGPFEGDGSTLLDFLILDLADPTCFGYAELESPDCNEECHIFDLAVDIGQCNEDGTYRLFLNFEYEGANNDFFDVFGPNNEFIGFFELADLPILIEHFPASGNAYDWLQV